MSPSDDVATVQIDCVQRVRARTEKNSASMRSKEAAPCLNW